MDYDKAYRFRYPKLEQPAKATGALIEIFDSILAAGKNGVGRS